MQREWTSQFSEYAFSAPENHVTKQRAISEELAGMRIFDRPLIGVAAADDPIFEELKNNPHAVGPHFLTPDVWLPGARSVVSFFLPFSERVRRSNYREPYPSGEWLHGRIEGQDYIAGLCRRLIETLARYDGVSVCPSLDERFFSVSGKDAPSEGDSVPPYTSNWSERHVAYACGLGTFGLSRGLITERGMAGRFGSVVTTLALEPTPRRYSGIYDHCTRCARCADRCPVGAITPRYGKDQALCAAYCARMKERFAPRYGCGKCQVGVPCEHANPTRAAR